MKTEHVAAKRSRAHARYRTKAGEIVPGVTTILNVLNKPALVRWSNDLGLKGISVGAYVDTLATVGTIAHEMVCCHNKKESFIPDGRAPELIDAAENSFLKYLEWERHHTVEPILCEAELVSEHDRFGGCIDFYGRIDGVLTLKDYKTAKAIWPEHLYQVAAYRRLLEENGHKVDAVGILQIGRSEDEGFTERTITDCANEWLVFYHCLQLYRLTKKAA